MLDCYNFLQMGSYYVVALYHYYNKVCSYELANEVINGVSSCKMDYLMLIKVTLIAKLATSNE